LPIIEKRLKLTQGGLSQDAIFEIIKQEKLKVDIEKEIKKLPYVFKDPIKFDKKVDPRRLRFGSRIDETSDDKATYFKVREIISPEILVLDNGLRIRLLGVKEIPEKNGEAIQFLRRKTRGQKLFMKFDNKTYDEKQNILCYLYLQNKTFLNAHLIKKGLADVDTSLGYRHKYRFLGYKSQARR
jgi:site-specific DNA-methyltransferase (adenine-specific)